MENLLYTIAQYGHITIELKPLMDKKTYYAVCVGSCSEYAL